MGTPKHEHQLKLVTKKVTLAEGKAIDYIKTWVCETESCNYSKAVDIEKREIR